jgi:hypothetical protein
MSESKSKCWYWNNFLKRAVPFLAYNCHKHKLIKGDKWSYPVCRLVGNTFSSLGLWDWLWWHRPRRRSWARSRSRPPSGRSLWLFLARVNLINILKCTLQLSKLGYHGDGAMTLYITALSIATLIAKTLSITALSITTLILTAVSIFF